MEEIKHIIEEDGTFVNTQEETNKNGVKLERNERGQFVNGWEGGPGRPKGKTLKEFARELLMTMNDEQKKVYLKELPKEIVWRMAEGNPHNTEDITSGGKPVPILHVFNNQRNQENLEPPKEDQSGAGGDIGQ